jgi:hypothetical protein
MHIPHKKKFFIKSQIPQYIREEYPLFLELMEQYYSFLDSEEGQIVAVKVIDGGSGYNPVSEWTGNNSYVKGQRFSFNNKIYSVVQDATSSTIVKPFTLNTVDGTTDVISFGTIHNLSTGDEVIYSFNGATGPVGSTGIIGLTDNQTYWVGVTSPTSVKLYTDRSSALTLGATGLVDLNSTIINQTHTFTSGPWHSGESGVYTFANVTSKFVSSGGPESVVVYFVTKNDIGVYVTDPRTGSAFGATATPILDSGVIKKIVVTNPGSGYTKEEEPRAIVTGGNGSGAVLETVTTTDFGGLNASITASQYSRDIDETIERCIQSLRRELIPDIPDRLYLESDNLAESREVDVRKFIKFIKQFYNSKGAEKSIQFLFRILFDSDVQIYYPKTDMLRVSDGKWSEDFVIRVTPINPEETEESFTESFLGERIIGLDSGATATIQSVVDIAIAGAGLTLELRLTEINGTFDTDEEISVFDYDRTRSPQAIATIRPCISSLNIIDGGINYRIDDQIISVSSFLARVTGIGTVTEDPKYFDISSLNGRSYINFNTSTDVDGDSETITFRSNHGLDTGDFLVYDFNGATGPIGATGPNNLIDGTTYFARITGSTGVQLYTTYAGAIAGTTGLLVDLGATGLSQRHTFYKSGETPFIDTSSKTITFKTPHNFKTGRGLLYSFNGTTGPIGASGPIGLTDGVIYYSRVTGSTGVQLYTTYEGAVSGSTGLLVSLGSTGIYQIHSLSQVSENSITDYKIQNFGFNYQTQPNITASNTEGGQGAEFTANFSGLLKYDGDYIGTDGQPSSIKKIQDSEYYQDFSYEIISDQSARIFGTILEKTIHPAGLRYFSRILSVRDESLYEERDNYNVFYEQFTFFVTDPAGQTDFDISSFLDNGIEWQAGDNVNSGQKIFVRVGSDDYIFIVSRAGQFGSTPPTITVGEQTNGTAALVFSGVAEQVLSVFVNGVLQEYGVDFTMKDANTVEFFSPLPLGSIVRIYKREDILIETEYQDYIQSFTTVVSKRNKFVRDSFDAYRWYPGTESTPKLWQQTGATSFLQNDIVVWNNNYYLVTQAGEPGRYPPTHVERSYPNGTTIMKYYPQFRGYNGDIIFNGNNFYKVTGNSIAAFSAELGSTGPTHTIGVTDAIISNGGVSNVMSPGGYSLVITGATGSGAAGTANLSWGSTGVFVSSVQITHSGSAYDIVPTITISGATGFNPNYSITAITGPATAVNGKTSLTYYDPGYSFWSGSTGVDVNDIIKYEGNWYKVIESGTTTGASGPNHNMGSQLSGTARLEYYPIDHAKTTTLPVVSELDPGKAMLGPTVNDIVRNIGTGIPDFFQNVFGTVSITPSVDFSQLDLGETGLSDQDDEYIGYTIIITFPDTTRAIRTVIDYDGTTKTVTLSSPDVSPGTNGSLSYRMIQNYLIHSVSAGSFSVPDPGATGLTIGLSEYDLAYNLNPLTGATGVLGATGITKYTFDSATAIIGATGPSGSVGATGYMINIPAHELSNTFRLTYNNNGNSNLTGLTSGELYYVIVVDSDNIQLADSYYNAVAGATGATGFAAIAPGSGNHKLHPQNDLYKNFNLIISSGDGTNSVLNIKEYDEITNTIQCYGYPTGTITPNNSTYFVYPDLYAYPGGATGPSGSTYNDDHYGGSILSLSISSGGVGYSTANTVSFVGGYGIGAAATITSVDGTGRITGIVPTNIGRGYIYEPRIAFSPGATGIVGTGAIIKPVISPLNSTVSVETISRYSMFGHYQYYVNDSSITTSCSSVIGLDRIILTDDSFDTSNLYLGQSVSGSGIAANTRIRNISDRIIELDKPTTSTSSFTVTFTGKPHPMFEYGETLVQQSTSDPLIFNKMRVIKYDRINKILYVEKDEESDELNTTNHLSRSRNNSTITIIGSAGSEMYSGWKSINQPIGCIIKSYPL